MNELSSKIDALDIEWLGLHDAILAICVVENEDDEEDDHAELDTEGDEYFFGVKPAFSDFDNFGFGDADRSDDEDEEQPSETWGDVPLCADFEQPFFEPDCRVNSWKNHRFYNRIVKYRGRVIDINSRYAAWDVKRLRERP